MPVYKLSKGSNLFPPPALADYDGLLAYGGDLSVERLLNAYSNGIFPWYNPGEEILWWSPQQRFVIFPKEVHVSRSMRKIIKKGELRTEINTDFSQIIGNCKKTREGETWIADEMEAAYTALFFAGNAMCVGVYAEKLSAEELVGGLYGVAIGKCFFGESMFSKVANASKLALIRLCEELENFAFIDCQFHTPHLESIGGRYVSWKEYRQLLRQNL